MSYLKIIHVGCAVLTAVSFILRGIWMMRDSVCLGHRMTRIAPHVIDTCLLVSAILLLFQRHLDPLSQPWLLAKIAMLFVYIMLGLMAFRFARIQSQKIGYWLAALAALACIFAFALSKQVVFWQAMF